MIRRFVLPAVIAGLPLSALADVPSVTADTPVAHSFAAMVMGDLGSPALLLDRGGDPHHMQLRPSQARAVANADLVIWSGAGLAPWMARVVDSLGDGATLDLSTVAGLHTAPRADGTVFAASEEAHDDHDHDHDHDHDDEHEHEHEDEHEDEHDHQHEDDHDHDHDYDHDHDHDHTGIDPHLWMTPENAAPWLDAIATQLSTLDPQNAAAYAANAAAAGERIDTLTAELAAILEPVGRAGLVMHHAAYGYFAEAFGLNILGTIALGDAADPGAARIAALRAALTEADAVCIFPEVNHSPAYAGLIAEGSALRIGAPLDPAGVMLEPGPDLYADALRGLARAIADCAAGTR